MKLIDKAALVAEIENCIDKCNAKKKFCPVNTQVESICENKIYAYTEILSFIDTLEVKEINTWHLQEKEDIYDAVKDWGLYSFICLMDDGSIQKFTGTLCECSDGSINRHIDAIDDNYNVDNIIFWIEAPL